MSEFGWRKSEQVRKVLCWQLSSNREYPAGSLAGARPAFFKKVLAYSELVFRST